MTYISYCCEKKSVVFPNYMQSSIDETINNYRQLITTYISPYCSMCCGTGRCGTCLG